MKKNIEILTKEILEEYIAGSSLEKIKDKYGDFGIDYINKYKKQNVTGNLIDLFSSKNNEELKKEIQTEYLKNNTPSDDDISKWKGIDITYFQEFHR